ncbi:hypothetical protein GALMADRAFT_233035 [Galerina marginata CBS 339.88]|uniref:PEBP-like protein n=1 Tax=Galerina marginata (strain CBS 339.88) TaxID=685588 RepID=A0A067TNB4_GALM3|nr:hypothetical protein GALMADRAFT_233035 [Galerina marginata CBS 339.88]
MFTVRRLSSTVPRSLSKQTRGNATLSVASSASQVAPLLVDASSTDPAESKTQGRRTRNTTKRPSISLENPRKWNRALPQGVMPAYDLALQYLHQDSHNLKDEVNDLQKAIDEKEALYSTLQKKLTEHGQTSVEKEMQTLDEELEKLLEKLNIIQVQSEINLPHVRWSVNNAMADMSNVTHRHLLEQKWRKDGNLDLLMERIHQMGVVPDVLPVIRPSIDLHVAARTSPSDFHKTGKVQGQVEPGVFLKSKQTLVPPKLYATVFHTDVRLYTMLLIDPDVPHPEAETFTTFLHWMKPNIPLSATSSNLTNLNDHTSYIPPHPQRGTPYHRYVCLLLPQPPLRASGYTLAAASRAGTEPTSAHLDIPALNTADRLGFDMRAFAERWDLDGANGGGAHMWREIWDEDVSAIYKDFLEQEEPRYGQPLKFDPYAQMKQQKKYIL